MSLAADLRAALLEQQARRSLRDLSLEQLLTDPTLAAFPPSPVQLALVRAADGRSIDGLLSPEAMVTHFGVTPLPPERPRLVVLRTGVRAGKSLISAIALLTSLLACQFRRPPVDDEVPGPDGLVGVRPGELVRALIVAPMLRVSRAPFDHLIGTMRASPRLAPLLVRHSAETAVIRRPDGHEVTVELVAAASGGTTLRSTWLAGCILDEADFHDGEDAAVNLSDQVRAVMPRLLPNAQVWVPSSPWADTGPFHELFKQAFGRPGRTLAFHSDSRSMNPTLSREDEEAERRRDPDNAAREYDAIPLSANSAAFFPAEAVKAAVDPTRPILLSPADGEAHWAGVDFGFRKNSSALAIARARGGRVVLAFHEELRPEKGAPLKPSQVCRLFGERCIAFGARTMRGDLYYADTAHEELGKVRDKSGTRRCSYDEWTPTGDALTEAFTAFRRLITEGRLELPDDPRLLKQIAETRMRPMPGGRIQVQLPKQGAAHGDVLMAVVLACTQVTTSDEPTIRRPRDHASRWGTSAGRGYG